MRKKCINLHDVFQTLQSTDPVPAEYILQFLWRDVTSSYDIIGPYFSFKATIDHATVVETLMETTSAFSNLGLKTACVVCDGASSNLAAIKLITDGQRGAYGFSADALDNTVCSLALRTRLTLKLILSLLFAHHIRCVFFLVKYIHYPSLSCIKI